MCRVRVTKAKMWPELNLAKDTKKKKGYSRYVSQNTKVKESATLR